ncbi:MAG TPA: FkbM family methyltransferase [Gemmatimonas sp.]|uniref:FkbM family methyltransferase n=1 Tax=Gemmatimonas sp. TaxID=1962908 RepID=UPI002ED8103B
MIRRTVRYLKRLVRDWPEFVRNLGWAGAAGFAFYSPVRELLAAFLPAAYAIRLPDAGVAYLRPGSSDRLVFEQIFVTEEYAPLRGGPSARAILDLGANCGMSSLWFLRTHPQAQVVAVEPDERNFAALQRNLRPYGDRVLAFRRAVWVSDAGIDFDASGPGWSGHIASQSASTIRVETCTMASLLAHLPEGRADIVKMDIEGAEIQLFQDTMDWTSSLPYFVVELHGDEAIDLALRHFSAPAWSHVTSGEVYVFRREEALAL